MLTKPLYLLALFVFVDCVACDCVALASDPKPELERVSEKQWQRLRRYSLSPDGKWLSYNWETAGEPHGDRSVTVIKRIDGDQQHVIENARGDVVFSNNSSEVMVAVPTDNGVEIVVFGLPNFQVKLRLSNPRELSVIPHDAKQLLAFGCDGNLVHENRELRIDEKTLVQYSMTDSNFDRIKDVEAFAQSRNQRSLAIVRKPATLELGAFDKGWKLLVSTDGKANLKELDIGIGRCENLVWSKDGRSLVFLHAKDEFSLPNELVVWTGIDTDNPSRHTLEAEKSEDWPAGLQFDSSALPAISSDGRYVTLQLKRPAPKGKAKTDVKAPTVWRTSDVMLPTERWDSISTGAYMNNQKLWSRFSHVWEIETGRLIGVNESTFGGARLYPTTNTVLTRNEDPYAHLRGESYYFYDLDRVDLVTGKREPILRRVSGEMTPAITEDGTCIVHSKPKSWVIHRNGDPSERQVESSDRLTAPMALHPGATVLSDDQTLVLQGTQDVWKSRINGEPMRLTDGVGQRRTYRFLEEVNEELFFLFEELSTKHTGISVLRENKTVDIFNCDGKCNADVAIRNGRVAVRFETYNRPPNVAVVDSSDGTVLFQTELAGGEDVVRHSRRELITYQDDSGRELQATLVYPTGFSPKRKYPAIAIVYPDRPKSHHRFRSAARGFFQDLEWYSQQGYVVIQPDLVAEPNNPGNAYTFCLDAALDHLAASGFVDMQRIAVVGGSHGGYVTLMALCRSDRFAVGVAVNPLTDLVTSSADLFEQAGEPNMGRVLHEFHMTRPFWEIPEQYIENSPLYLVNHIDAPLLLGVGKQDKKVHWRQSLYFFNALRSLNKPAQMVVHPKTGHGLEFPQFSHRVERFLKFHLKPSSDGFPTQPSGK